MDKKGVNGCGCGSGLLKYFKPPYHEFFEVDCNSHDMAYDFGGTEESRKHADVWLYRNMVDRATRYCKPLKATYLTCIALLYYFSVRLFGKNYFNFKK